VYAHRLRAVTGRAGAYSLQRISYEHTRIKYTQNWIVSLTTPGPLSP